MQRWKAILAPTRIPNAYNKEIAPDCVIALSCGPEAGIPLVVNTHNRQRIVGMATEAYIDDNYLVASGITRKDIDLAGKRPTFYIDQFSSAAMKIGAYDRILYTKINLASIHIGFIPTWGDPAILFLDIVEV